MTMLRLPDPYSSWRIHNMIAWLAVPGPMEEGKLSPAHSQLACLWMQIALLEIQSPWNSEGQGALYL